MPPPPPPPRAPAELLRRQAEARQAQGRAREAYDLPVTHVVVEHAELPVGAP